MGIDFGKIFGTSLRYPIRKDIYLVLFAIQIIFGIVGWLLTGYVGGGIIGPDGAPIMENIAPFLIYYLPLTFVAWIIMAFLLPAYLDNSAHFTKGKRKPILESLEASKKRFLPTLAVFVIIGLVLLACFGGLILLAASSVSITSSPEGLTLIAIGGIWFIIGTIIGIIFSFMAFLSPVFCALEKQKPLDSIRKSWKLVSKNKANTLIFLIILIVAYVAIAILGSLPEVAFLTLYGEPAALSPQSFLFMAIRTIANVYLVLLVISSVVVYYLGMSKRRL